VPSWNSDSVGLSANDAIMAYPQIASHYTDYMDSRQPGKPRLGRPTDGAQLRAAGDDGPPHQE